ncbi:MAG: nucleotidyl transferase AbiEii/AbiGii toxin family protein [Endomicrobiia bacterium]
MLDYLSIFREFNERKIKYIVVGGIAVNLYGIPRMTYDIDLILDLEDENLKKFLSLLKEWGFKPKVPVDIMDFSIREKRDNWIKNKNVKAFNFVNSDWAISEIDIVINTSVNYKNAYKKINYISIQGVDIPVISITHLIKMKMKSNRKQDIADVGYLKNLKNEKK